MIEENSLYLPLLMVKGQPGQGLLVCLSSGVSFLGCTGQHAGSMVQLVSCEDRVLLELACLLRMSTLIKLHAVSVEGLNRHEINA